MTIALFTALGYLVAAGFALPAVHFLGPRYTTQTTARPAIIAFGVFYTLALFFRAVSILFPGEVVTTAAISPIAPLIPWTLVVLNGLLLDFIMRHRAPPPLMERVVRFFLRRTGDAETAIKLAMALPTAAVCDVPSDEPCRSEMKRTYRVAVLIGGGLALAAIVLVVVLSSPVAK
jgi:hypothetical protein